MHALADVYGARAEWIISGEGEMLAGQTGDADFLGGLRALEKKVEEQGRLLGELANALAADPRWPQVEDRLNFLSEQMREFAMRELDEGGPPESPQWSPIDLTP